MFKQHTFWLKTAVILQFLSAALHSLSFIMEPEPANETEKQLLDLMNNHKMEAGMGFSPTFQNLFNAMSGAFTLLLIFGGVLSLYLLKKNTELSVLKGVTTIQAVIFGLLFAICACLTFFPPILCTGLVFISLLIARLTFPVK